MSKSMTTRLHMTLLSTTALMACLFLFCYFYFRILDLRAPDHSWFLRLETPRPPGLTAPLVTRPTHLGTSTAPLHTWLGPTTLLHPTDTRLCPLSSDLDPLHPTDTRLCLTSDFGLCHHTTAPLLHTTLDQCLRNMVGADFCTAVFFLFFFNLK